jgi:hypothetical protein
LRWDQPALTAVDHHSRLRGQEYRTNCGVDHPQAARIIERGALRGDHVVAARTGAQGFDVADPAEARERGAARWVEWEVEELGHVLHHGLVTVHSDQPRRDARSLYPNRPHRKERGIGDVPRLEVLAVMGDQGGPMEPHELRHRVAQIMKTRAGPRGDRQIAVAGGVLDHGSLTVDGDARDNGLDELRAEQRGSRARVQSVQAN